MHHCSSPQFGSCSVLVEFSSPHHPPPQATIRGTAMMKLAATEDTLACQWAARSKALYEVGGQRVCCALLLASVGGREMGSW